MDDIDFVTKWMEKQGLSFGAERAGFMMRPEGRYQLLLALRREIFKKDVSGYTPAPDLNFRERQRS
jgi:hypothetical protein